MAYTPSSRAHLAGPVQGQNLGPDENKRLAQVCGCCLQQLEHIGEDAHRQRQVHCPTAHIQEAPQQGQRPQPVYLAEEDLHTEGAVRVLSCPKILLQLMAAGSEPAFCAPGRAGPEYRVYCHAVVGLLLSADPDAAGLVERVHLTKQELVQQHCISQSKSSKQISCLRQDDKPAAARWWLDQACHSKLKGLTCSTMGSCSGGRLCSEPCSSQSSKAVSCSLKKGLGWNSAPSSRVLQQEHGGWPGALPLANAYMQESNAALSAPRDRKDGRCQAYEESGQRD